MNSKNNKGIKIVGGSLLALAIVALLSITYATYTQTLTISGSGTIAKQSWNVQFNSQVDSTASSGSPTVGTATAENTTLTIQDAALNKPGDSITYTFTVENKGTFDAELTGISMTSLNCKKTSDESSTTDFCNKNITVEVRKVETSNDVLLASTGKNKQEYSKSPLIHLTKTNGTQKMKLVIKYESDGSTNGADLSADDITIENFGATLTFSQSSED